MKELQDFLRANNVEFDVDTPIEQVEATKAKMEEEQAGKEKKDAKGKAFIMVTSYVFYV